MESGKGQAEKQEKRDGFDNIPKYNVSIISGGTADGEKNMRATRQVRVTCTTANQFAVF